MLLFFLPWVGEVVRRGGRGGPRVGLLDPGRLCLLLLLMSIPLPTLGDADSGIDANDGFPLPPEVECRAPLAFLLSNGDDTGGCSLCDRFINPGTDETDWLPLDVVERRAPPFRPFLNAEGDDNIADETLLVVLGKCSLCEPRPSSVKKFASAFFTLERRSSDLDTTP